MDPPLTVEMLEFAEHKDILVLAFRAVQLYTYNLLTGDFLILL